MSVDVQDKGSIRVLLKFSSVDRHTAERVAR